MIASVKSELLTRLLKSKHSLQVMLFHGGLMDITFFSSFFVLVSKKLSGGKWYFWFDESLWEKKFPQRDPSMNPNTYHSDVSQPH